MIEEEGPGWRLARDPSRGRFPVMIAGESWAIELTEDEWNSLIPLIKDLIDQHQQLENQLMPEEGLELELERQGWWCCLEGDRNSWTLKLILQSNSNDFPGTDDILKSCKIHRKPNIGVFQTATKDKHETSEKKKYRNVRCCRNIITKSAYG